MAAESCSKATLPKTALITGVGGQDGRYLAEHLLGLGRRVIGVSHPQAAPGPQLEPGLAGLGDFSHLVVDLMKPGQAADLLARVRPEEVYHLAGPSSVAASFKDPEGTRKIITGLAENLLKACLEQSPPPRLLNAGSSECFGETRGLIINEDTPSATLSPYGQGKAATRDLVREFRAARGLFACTALMFNHESPLRPAHYVTMKIAAAAAAIAGGSAQRLRLGNLWVARDWGWAPEYVRALPLILAGEKPGDYIIASGATHTLRDFLEHAFGAAGLDWQDHVDQDPSLVRAHDFSIGRADVQKAARLLGWRAQSSTPQVAARLVAHCLADPPRHPGPAPRYSTQERPGVYIRSHLAGVAGDGGAAHYDVNLLARFKALAAQSHGNGFSFLFDEFSPAVSGLAGRLVRWAGKNLPQPLTRGALAAGREVRQALGKIRGAGSGQGGKARLFSQCRLVHELSNYFLDPEIEEFFAGSPVQRPKLCVTFFDVQDLFFPRFFSRQVRRERRRRYEFYAGQADHFFAISDYTGRTLQEKLGVPPEKISTTHLAHDELTGITPTPAQKQRAAALGNFALYPAKFWPHKNHTGLFAAMAREKTLLRQEKTKVVLTGGMSPKDEREMEALARRHGVEDLLVRLGWCEPADLVALYLEAKAVFFPSLFEGFGIPLLEAMQLGCPVVAAKAGSLPEIGGPAGYYFDPNDPEQTAQALHLLVSGGLDFAAMRRAGFQQAARFSWQNTAQKTLAVYRRLLEG